MLDRLGKVRVGWSGQFSLSSIAITQSNNLRKMGNILVEDVLEFKVLVNRIC